MTNCTTNDCDHDAERARVRAIVAELLARQLYAEERAAAAWIDLGGEG